MKFTACHCKNRKPRLNVIHIFEGEDVIEFWCDNCNKVIVQTNLNEIYKNKTCHCCYCDKEKKY